METMTEKKQRIIDRACLPVELQPRENMKGEVKRCTVDAQSGKLLAIVSDRYELVNNSEVIPPLVNRFGVDALINYRSAGGHFHAFTFETGRRIELPGGDVLKERILAFNSYNKSKAFCVMAGAFRLVCSNGMYVGQAAMTFRKIHVGDIPAADIVQKAIDAITSYDYNVWHKMAATPVTPELEHSLTNELSVLEEKEDFSNKPRWQIPDGSAYAVNNHVRRIVNRLIDQTDNMDYTGGQHTAWGYYNTVNRAIASTMRNPSDYTRRITANKRAEHAIVGALVPATPRQLDLPLN